MKPLVLSAACCAFFMLWLLLYPLGLRWQRRKDRLDGVMQQNDAYIPEELSKPFAQRARELLLHGVIGRLARLISDNERGRRRGRKLDEQLMAAQWRLSSREFAVIRLISEIGGIALGACAFALPVSQQQKLLIFAAVACVGILCPSMLLRRAVAGRCEALRRELPDVLDLIVVSLEAGMGFDGAVMHLAEQKDGPLVRELADVIREVQMGRPRRDCLRELAERAPVQELKVFVTAQLQAEQLGVSIRNVLAAQADSLRLARRQRAEEKAMKAPVKMLIPMVLFIFPVMFIILLAPSMINVFSKM